MTEADHSREARRLRAAARANWPVKVGSLTDPPQDNLLATTTAEERVAMVWAITKDVWEMSGRTIPDYPRDQIPGRVIRPGERAD
jgi:hypothetical protein